MLTKEQKIELERQANNYSFVCMKRKFLGVSTDIPNAKLSALFMAMDALGYEFRKRHTENILGIDYYKYKLVKIRKDRER